MPSEQDPTDQKVNFWLPVVLYAQFKKRAKELGMDMSEIIVAFMLKTCKNTKLTDEEYAECLARIERNRQVIREQREKRRLGKRGNQSQSGSH